MRYQHRKQIFISFLVLLLFTTAGSAANKKTDNKKTATEKMQLLVSSKWLSEHLNDADLIVLDTTVIVRPDKTGKYLSSTGRPAYDAGHIPTAGFADLTGNLSAQGSALELVMPTPEQFAAAMGELGVGNDSRVVLYSADNHVWAARLWWMFRWAGFDRVSLLDGGFNAWKAEGRAVSTDTVSHPKKKLTLSLRPAVIADRDEVFAAIKNAKVDIFDAMPAAHYQGKFSMYARPGHITSATNMPTSDLYDESGLYKSYDEMDLIYDSDRSKRSITYCGGGVAASAVAFNLYRLGFNDVAVYMGSLQEWAVDPANPMTVEMP